MKLTPPKKWIWYVSLFIGLVSIFFRFTDFAGLQDQAFWIMAISWLLLLFATLLKGL